MIALLMVDVYVALIAKRLGFTDSATGVVTSIASLGGVFQLVTLLLKKKKPKKFVILMSIANQILFGMLYVIPLVNDNVIITAGVKRATFVVCILGAYLIYNICAPRKESWMMTFVDKSHLARFRADLSIVSHIVGMIFTYVMGNVVDIYKNRSAVLEATGDIAAANHEMNIAFIICAIVIFANLIAHAIVFGCGTDVEPSEKEKIGTVQRVKVLLKDRQVIKMLCIFVVYNASVNISTSFFGTYKMGELGFSMKFASILTVMSSVIGMACSRIWGNLGDKHTLSNMLCFSFPFRILAYGIVMFCVPSNGKILFPIYIVLNTLGYSGAYNAICNLNFKLIDKAEWEDAIALIFAVSGVVSFLSTSVASLLVSRIQANGNVFLGMQVYAQQVLSCVTFVLSCVFYAYLLLHFRKKNVRLERESVSGLE